MSNYLVVVETPQRQLSANYYLLKELKFLSMSITWRLFVYTIWNKEQYRKCFLKSSIRIPKTTPFFCLTCMKKNHCKFLIRLVGFLWFFVSARLRFFFLSKVHGSNPVSGNQFICHISLGFYGFLFPFVLGFYRRSMDQIHSVEVNLSVTLVWVFVSVYFRVFFIEGPWFKSSQWKSIYLSH